MAIMSPFYSLLQDKSFIVDSVILVFTMMILVYFYLAVSFVYFVFSNLMVNVEGFWYKVWVVTSYIVGHMFLFFMIMCTWAYVSECGTFSASCGGGQKFLEEGNLLRVGNTLVDYCPSKSEDTLWVVPAPLEVSDPLSNTKTVLAVTDPSKTSGRFSVCLKVLGKNYQGVPDSPLFAREDVERIFALYHGKNCIMLPSHYEIVSKDYDLDWLGTFDQKYVSILDSSCKEKHHYHMSVTALVKLPLSSEYIPRPLYSKNGLESYDSILSRPNLMVGFNAEHMSHRMYLVYPLMTDPSDVLYSKMSSAKHIDVACHLWKDFNYPFLYCAGYFTREELFNYYWLISTTGGKGVNPAILKLFLDSTMLVGVNSMEGDLSPVTRLGEEYKQYLYSLK